MHLALTWTFPHVSGILPYPCAGMTLTALGRNFLAGHDMMHSDNNQEWCNNTNNSTNNSTNNGTPHALASLSHTSSCCQKTRFERNFYRKTISTKPLWDRDQNIAYLHSILLETWFKCDPPSMDASTISCSMQSLWYEDT
eukprot:scaffold58865_cov72-Attheya_sp.AAC.1